MKPQRDRFSPVLDRGAIQIDLHRALNAVTSEAKTAEALARQFELHECKGNKNDPVGCPLQRAISFEFGDQVEVYQKSVWFHDVKVPLPPHANEFVVRFDGGDFSKLSRHRGFELDYFTWYFEQFPRRSSRRRSNESDSQ